MTRTHPGLAAAPEIESWVNTHYNVFPGRRLGLRGASLLLDFLRSLGRRSIVLPAFICTDLPAMARHLGMRIVHIDVDRETAQMRPDQLRRCLAGLDESDAVLLLDHVFGYPAAAVAEWKRAYPNLVIIEDCVRALGAEVDGVPVGQVGDAALFSLYKTTTGNDDGALLLSRLPQSASDEASAPGVTFRQWAAGVKPLRLAHSWIKRLAPPVTTASRELDAPLWTPASGVPNWLCCRRFEAQLRCIAEDRKARHLAGEALSHALADVKDIRLIAPPPGTRTSSFYLSFTLARPGQRDAIINTLQRRGLFLAWAWNVVPSFYRCFGGTFPYGAAGSEFLAGHICHVPLELYRSPRLRQRLIENIRKAVVSFK